MDQKPWDAKLAFALVKPLAETPASPNAFTTLRLLVGLAAAYVYAQDQQINLAVYLFALSYFLVHPYGELTPLTGKTSPFSHFYDIACDAIVMTLLFISIGFGLQAKFDLWNILTAALAGVSVIIIFQLRNIIENRLDKTATKQASIYGYEKTTPPAKDERRIALSIELFTNPQINGFGRFISNIKDSVAYFGFKQAFSKIRFKNYVY